LLYSLLTPFFHVSHTFYIWTVAVYMSQVAVSAYIVLLKPFVKANHYILLMVCFRVMPVPGLAILSLNAINRPVLNSRCIALFQTGVCLRMSCVVVSVCLIANTIRFQVKLR